MNLYNEKKKQKKRKRFLDKEGLKPNEERVKLRRGTQGLGEEDEEEG